MADVEPDDGLVRVHVRAAGICGSDLHLIEWGPMPVTLGHEFAGVLDDGTAVAVQPYTPCLQLRPLPGRRGAPVPPRRWPAATASPSTAGWPTP